MPASIRTLLFLSSLLFGLGLHGSVGKAGVDITDKAPRSPIASMMVLDGSEIGGRALPPGTTVKSGQTLRVEVSLQAPRHVYLLHEQHGKVVLLHGAAPADGAVQPSAASGRLLLPDGAPHKSYTLDETVGVERLHLLVNPQPLNDVLAIFSQWLRSQEAKGASPGPKTLDACEDKQEGYPVQTAAPAISIILPTAAGLGELYRAFELDSPGKTLTASHLLEVHSLWLCHVAG